MDELFRAGCTIEETASAIAIGRTTFYAVAEKEGIVLSDRRAEKLWEGISIARYELFKKVRKGDTACLALYLKNNAGWKDAMQEDIKIEIVHKELPNKT